MSAQRSKPLVLAQRCLPTRAQSKAGATCGSAISHSRSLLGGVVFRRQVPLLGRFIADFLAPAQRLVIEIDGGYHRQRRRADSRRDAVLARGGYRVLRLDAALVVRNIEAAVALVRGALGC
jgi:very-short-patch-repair endonuclease